MYVLYLIYYIYLQPAEASETRIQLPGLEEEVRKTYL